MISTIYYIDRSIAESFSDHEALFFEDLASAYQHGNCYICGDPTSLQYLSKNLGSSSKDVYKLVLSHHTEHGMIMKAVQHVFVLTYQKDVSILPDVLQAANK